MDKYGVLIVILLLLLSGCNEDYCYKGHDNTYGPDLHKNTSYTIRVCDEWRNTAGKYPPDKEAPK